MTLRSWVGSMWGISSNWSCWGQDMECEMRWHLAHTYCAKPASTLTFTQGTYIPWIWKQCVPLTNWLARTRLHAVVIQETTIWTFTTIRTSNIINVKFYLSTAWRHRAEAEVQLHSFLASALGVEWLISCPDHFTPEKEHKFPSNRRLRGPQSQSRCFEEQKNLWIWTQDHLAQSIVTIPTLALQLVPEVL